MCGVFRARVVSWRQPLWCFLVVIMISLDVALSLSKSGVWTLRVFHEGDEFPLPGMISYVMRHVYRGFRLYLVGDVHTLGGRFLSWVGSDGRSCFCVVGFLS